MLITLYEPINTNHTILKMVEKTELTCSLVDSEGIEGSILGLKRPIAGLINIEFKPL